MTSGRKIVIKIGSFPFLRGPTRFRKFRHTSESLKRHWNSVPASFSFGAFDPKTKTNFEGEILYRAPTSVKISDSRIFLGVSCFFWADYVANQWYLLNSSRVILLQRLVPNSSSSWALQPSGVWLKILLGSKTIFLCKYEQSHLLCHIPMATNLRQVPAIIKVTLAFLK